MEFSVDVSDGMQLASGTDFVSDSDFHILMEYACTALLYKENKNSIVGMYDIGLTVFGNFIIAHFLLQCKRPSLAVQTT